MIMIMMVVEVTSTITWWYFYYSFLFIHWNITVWNTNIHDHFFLQNFYCHHHLYNQLFHSIPIHIPICLDRWSYFFSPLVSSFIIYLMILNSSHKQHRILYSILMHGKKVFCYQKFSIYKKVIVVIVFNKIAFNKASNFDLYVLKKMAKKKVTKDFHIEQYWY